MKVLLHAPIGLALLANCLAQITNLFQIDFTTNLNGGCGYVGPDNLNNIGLDAMDLAIVGRQLMLDYKAKVPEAERLVDSFFKVAQPPLSDAQWQLLHGAFDLSPKHGSEQDVVLTEAYFGVSDNYDKVAFWLWGGGPYNLQGPGNVKNPPPNPWLLCYSNALQKKSMDSQAFDANGNILVQDGAPLTLNEIEEYVEAQENLQDVLDVHGGGAAVPVRYGNLMRKHTASYLSNYILTMPWRSAQYWFGRGGFYIFDEDYGPGESYCSLKDQTAFTDNYAPVSMMVLCPEAFGGSNTGFNPASPPAINVRRRVPCSNIQAVSSAELPTEEGEINPSLQSLKGCYPTAETLLHESFHLVLGNEPTHPPGDEVYNLLVADDSDQRLVGLDYSIASRNAESFAVAAVAYDYTFLLPPDANGYRLEFWSGYATRG
jgi:hypothetical protein